MSFSRFFRPPIAMGLCVILLIGGRAAAGPSIESIMAMLPDDPRPLGRPIDDRAAWDPVARSPAGIKAIADAAALLEKPMDEFDRDLYMAFYENGNRTRSQRHNGRRWGRLCVLTLGELLENRGRFIPAIQQSVASLCRDPSWVLSAHDRNAGVITGRTVYVDLAAAMNGYNTALADSLLGDRLDEPTRRLIRENLQRRVVDPIFDAIRSPDGTRGGLWWRNTTNNWNAVCTAGTTGVILATVQSKRDRAEAVAAALDNTTRFLSGFTGDGYCSEGVHYWSFGMGHFAVLRQLLLEQTGGRIDLLDDPRAKIAAQFPLKIHLLDGVWPAFADAEMRARPADEVMTYLGWRPASPQPTIAGRGPIFTGDQLLYWTMIELFSPAAGAVTGPPPDSARRTWFDQGGVLIVRPDDSTRRRFAAALKAGHNAEHHNHNDVGSYVVALDGQAPLLDGGWMVYTADNARYAKGYQFAMINSYGHSVPVVDGQLQQPGADARARILATQFTDAVDTFAIDLTACYPDANLSSLQRTWTYDRRGDGTLTVTDQVQFKKVGTFETALIGVEDWRRDETGVLYVRSMRGDRVAALWIQIACDHPYELLAERIENPGKFEPIRVGIRLTEPVRQANVTLTIHPADAAAAEQAPSMPIIGRRLMIDVPIERGTSR